MKKQRSLIVGSGRLGVLASAVAAALGTGAPTYAQDPLEEIVVTGSRIVRRDLEANSPIITVDAARFEETSTIAIESVINQMPQFVPAASQFESEGTSTGGYQSGPTRTVGAATLSLRGLGSNRNLVLLDGRRAQPVNANMAVNINSIPSAAVARVETITGGASSVYGADAIAGVVNFVLKSDYEGLDVDMQWGQTAEGDGTERRTSAVLGTNFSDGRGNVLIGFEKSDRGEIRKRDREFFQTGYADPGNIGDGRITAASIVLDATNAPPISVVRQIFPNAPASGRTGSFHLNSDGTLYRSNAWGANRYTGPFLDADGTTAWRKLESDGDLSQNRTHIQAQYPLDRYSLFAKGHYEITDNVRIFGQGLFVDSTGRAIGPLNAFVGGWGASVPHGTDIYAPSLNTDGTTNAAYLAGGPYRLNCPATGGCTNSQAWPKPPEVALLADARPRPNEPLTFGHNPNYVGAKVNTTENTTYQLTYGLEGDFTGRDWTWEVYGSHGETKLQATFEGNGRLEGWRFLTNFPNYGTGLEYTGNPFGDAFGAGTVYCTTGWNVMYGVNGMTETLYDDGPQGFMPSQDCIDAVTYIGKDYSTMVQDIAEVNLQGALVEMPAGQLRFALGASHRENEYSYIPDSLVTNAAIVDNTAGVYPADPSFGSISASDLYGELLVPLLSDKPGVREMNLELGYRRSSNDPTEDVDSYKALLDWRVTERIRVRGGHQVANRAPNVAELFQSREQQFYYINNGDWCSEENPVNPNSPNPALNPNAAQARAICESLMGPAGASVFYSGEQPDAARSARWFYVVGNPNLVPESAGTTTLGVVANITDQTTLSVDYWNIKISDMVSSEYVETFHEQCFSPATNPTFDPNHASCQLVRRNQSNGAQSPYFVSFTNEAAVDMAGIDVSLDWSRPVGPGAMSVNFQASFLDHAKTRPAPDAPFVDWKGSVGPSNISGLSGYSFDYRTITRLSYNQGGWTATLRWQHKPSITSEGHITNPNTATEVPTGAYDLFDVNGRYAFGGDSRYDLRFGIDNLFDAQPEIVFADATSTGTGRTDANIYDILGRRFYVGLTFSF
jgi:outer membrane receptor protein involved in Fe transport